MVDINADAVLIAVVTEAVLFGQRASKFFRCKRSGFSSQPSRQLPGFDFFVLLAGIALLLLRRSLRLGKRDENRIDHLATASLKTLGAQICLKHLEELLDHSLLAQFAL